jgi:spore cortex formation protein SpoVR/YcgB (stage V sporulation)
LNELYDRGYVTDGFMFEFLQSHTSVIAQPAYDSPYFSGINPYTLGFSMFMDIRRICENPTAEDREWFPDIAGTDWNKTVHFAMQNFKDESFILQFLSPKVMRDLKLFSIVDDDRQEKIQVNAIHNEMGFRRLREALAGQYNLGNREPNLQVYEVNIRGDRSLTLHHTMHNRKPLGKSTGEVLRHLHRLWGFNIHLHSVDGSEIKESFHCPPKT